MIANAARSVGLFDHETDVAPASPIMVGRSMRIDDPDLVARVCFRNELGKGSVVMDIVRHEKSSVAQPLPELPKLPKHVAIAMRTVMQEHIDRRGQFAAPDKIFHSSSQRYELGPKLFRNQSAMIAILARLQAV